MLLKRLLSRCLAVALAALAPSLASAEAWPARPVRIIVPFAAGGATDVVARLLAQKLNEAWGQGVVVEDRPGAGGNIGADVVAKSTPDGYTLLMASGSIVTANPFMYKSMSFDPAKDLAPITNVASGPQVIAVAKSVPAKTLREFIAYVKANPGKVNYGSAGVGTQVHLAGENFAYAAGLDMTHVPYKGEASALSDLVGGQIQMVPANLGAAINLVKGGEIRALAVTSRARSSELPGVPAVDEVVPGFENAGWFGLMAPAGTPREVIEKVYRDTAKALQGEAFKVALAKQGMTPVGNSPAAFQAAIRDETARWAKVIHERHLQAH
ncbi:MAG TPA: tripartite tricarboxylate transporter substrate binding protein [Usitatibacter sp.]|nr:tripartite tricarboxylate transporter substrate binding protein [Usitatibacter sp.]